MQVAKELEYTLASRHGERTPAIQRPVEDIGETAGRAVLQEQQGGAAQATSPGSAAAALPSLADLLQPTPDVDSAGRDAAANVGDAAPDPVESPLQARTDNSGRLGEQDGVTEDPYTDRFGGSSGAAEMPVAADARGSEGRAQELQQSEARGALRRTLRPKLDLNFRDVDWQQGAVEERGWGYGEAAGRRTLLTQAELESLLSDTTESTDSL